MHVALRACLLLAALASNRALAFPASVSLRDVSSVRTGPRCPIATTSMAAPSNRPRVRDRELLAVLQGQAIQPAYYGQMTAPAQHEVQDEISEAMAALESAAQLRREMRLAKKAQRRQSALLYSNPFSDIYTDPWVSDTMLQCTLAALYAMTAVAMYGCARSDDIFRCRTR